MGHRRHRFPPRHAAARGFPALLAVFACACAHAQTAVVLPPVVVSASTYAQPLSAALPSVSVLTREDIETSGAHNLSTLLRQVAGVQMTSAGGPGQSGNVFIRGFSGPNVLVLLDGVPMNAQDSTGNAYLGNLQTRQIERVEVIRGNVSAIYGSGAVGGVVLITTRGAGSEPHASVSVGGGSQGTASLSAQADAIAGRTELQGGFSRYTTQGIASQDPVQSGLPNESDGYRNNTANLSIRQKLAPGHEVGLLAFDSQGRYTYDNGTAGGSTHQSLFGLHADDRFTQAWTSHLSLSQQTTSTSYGGSYPADYRTRIEQLEWRNVLRLSSAWTATGGLDLQRQSIDSDGNGGIPSVSRHADAVFAGIDGTLSGNELQLNLRRDDVGGFQAQDTAYLGWGRPVGGGFKLLADASTAFNAPPLGYLYYQVPGVFGTLPNPQLRPEKAHSVEAGLQWARGSQYLRATVFQTTATDQWAYVTVDPVNFIGQFQNIDSARTRGLELSLRGAHRDWRWHGNLTLQDPVNTSPGAGNAAIPLVPHTLANAGLQRELGGLLLASEVHYSGPRYDPFGGVTLGSYAVVDLSAGRSINREWSWRLRVDNLFDRHYQTNYGYQTQPLGVFLELTWTPVGA
ncbi:MAG: TonB-dependent receptor [Betaproteobacteria bacterium]|nr:TonB-dependent receptor [Betaproteobacteria bacterium]MBU6512630.1 TonB-dependent receptor [Betaproteobacteria bacterium]MDE1955643.1 TonB-dependent receptor [Betaproteobacteria bacterium]MDE2152006.1 TonB-dependent receptor [Betaproteobacteria bacterium]